jgi:hypothetical protein
MESEIHPLTVVESAARAATAAKETTTTSKAMMRFKLPPWGSGESDPA